MCCSVHYTELRVFSLSEYEKVQHALQADVFRHGFLKATAHSHSLLTPVSMAFQTDTC